MGRTQIETKPSEILGISHINIVVDDINLATNFYSEALGFKIAENDDGAMDYKNVELESFARNAGFLDGKVQVDVRFLQHPTAKIFIELMRYQHPVGRKEPAVNNTYDVGGPRHIALAVSDVTAMFHYLLTIPGVRMINQSENYGPPIELTPFPIKFFYFLDPWGTQWELEEGRPMGTIPGIIG